MSQSRPSRRLRSTVLGRVALGVGVAALWTTAAVLLWDTSVPDDLRLRDVELGPELSPAEVARSERYERFLRWNGVLSLVVLLVVMGVYAARGARLARESAAGRIGTGMLLGMLGLALVWLAQLPFGLADLWWQRRHDLSYQDYASWVFESWFALGSEFLFICFALLIVMLFAIVLGRSWWVAGAPAFVGIGLLFAFLYPYLLPELEPLRDPQLTSAAAQFARRAGEDPVAVRVEEVEELTSAPNAEAAGLGVSRRIVLWDTLLDGRFPDEQVRVVLAHELGHHWREHIPKSLGWYALLAVPGAFLIARATRRRGGMAEPRAVPLALFVLVGLQVLAMPLQNAVSRRLEAEADWVALQTTRDPDAARGLFVRFSETAFVDPSPPGWASFLFDTHPSLEDRVAMAEAWAARRNR